MKVHVLPEAQCDLLDVFNFYEEQELGLGERAYQCLEKEIDSLEQTAGQHPIRYKNHRLVVGGAFPYFCIYYKIKQDEVLVHAVIDHRRDPARIRRQLRTRS